MSHEASGASSVSSSGGAAGVAGSAGAAGVAGSGKPPPTSSTVISSMEQLKRDYPDLYNKILLSLAQNICIQVNRGNDRLVRAMKKLREDQS